jgi:TP901 family phage tail tape measure protein
MSASKVRSGQVYVEIGADPSKFFNALKKINAKIAGLGRDLSSIGARLGGAGVGLAAPFVASIAAGTKFQDTLLSIRASTGATAAELDAVRTAAMQMSQALGIGPTQATQGMLELLKAGMSLGDVLGGAGKAAIEFAKVGELDVGTAAVVMSDAMNVFGVSAETAANTLSAAADSSSTSISKMAESFSMVAAVAAQSNQSIGDVSAALAILANNGVKGSDAGTSLKTMLLRLKAPVDEAESALAEMGLSVMSFRNADGTMKPMVEIIRTLAEATRGMDAAMRDDIFRRVFGQDAIRAAEIFSQVGVEGFENMESAMGNAMPVAEKFKTLMGGLTGAGIQIASALERLSIVVSEALAGGIKAMLPPTLGAINALTEFASKNAALVSTIANVAFGAIAAGAAFVSLGAALQAVAFGLGGVLGAMRAALAPLGLAVRVVSSLAGAAASAIVSILGMANAAGGALVAGATSAARAFGVYLAGCASVVAGSIASAAAVAAAWIAPAAPILAIGAAIAGAGALVYTFGGQIRSALAPVGTLVSEAASAIGPGFNQAVADGAVVMGDLYNTATTTFGGIYDAITAGDLSGAMDILWAGLVAGWLRGVEAIMSYVDPWITAFQNVFTDLGTNIAILWDQMWTTLATTQIGATIIGVFDNIANTVMATFDWLVGNVQKAWIRVQGFITGAKDTEERIKAIDNENAMRAEQRAQERPGIEGRQKQAAEQGDKMRAESEQRQAAMVSNAEGIKADRERENQRRADERRAATVGAEKTLEQKAKDGKSNRAMREQARELGQNIGNAQTMDEIHQFASEMHALNAAGRLTAEEFAAMQEQLGIQQEKIAEREYAQDAAARKSAEAGAAGAGAESVKSKADVAGTFSAVAAAGMGFGSTLQERIAKASEETAKNTRGMGKPKVAE